MLVSIRESETLVSILLETIDTIKYISIVIHTMKSRINFYLLLLMLVLAIFVAGCAQKILEDEPKWLKEMIKKEINTKNSPGLILKCAFKSEIVYYLPPRCCDIPSTLFDEKGKAICSPDGGFTGGGDGKCPDFFEERQSCKAIWNSSSS